MGGNRSGSPSLTFLAVALAIVTASAVAAVQSAVPAWIGVLAGVNAATVVLYGYDKAVAGGTWTRVPERVLLLLALLGGSPAAILSSRLFRHKTVKPSFRRGFWIVVLVQVAVLGAAAWWWWRRSHGA